MIIATESWKNVSPKTPVAYDVHIVERRGEERVAGWWRFGANSPLVDQDPSWRGYHRHGPNLEYGHEGHTVEMK
jgi:hypothetical protein